MLKRLNNLRYKDGKFTLLAKILLTLVYLWSCFFWSGVTILNFYINTPEYSYLSTGFLTGSILITVGMVLIYLRCYISQFALCAAGTAVFLKNACEMIDVAAKSEVVFKPSFELRYMPVIALVILSFVLAIISLQSIISERQRVKNEFNNSPTQSIFEKRDDKKR